LWTGWGLFAFQMVSLFSEERSPLVGQSCSESPPFLVYCRTAHSPEYTHTHTHTLSDI